MNLGENLRLTSDDGASFTPAGVLRKVLRDSPHGRDVEAVVDSLADELKRRFASRRRRCATEKVCITWRGVATNLSTMSRATTMDVSDGARDDEEISTSRSTRSLAVGSGDDAFSGDGNHVRRRGVFLANAAWTSRGSHFP